MLLPPADPAGAKPRRDHRFLDRVSRHEVPKTPENDAFKVYDPARVSHIPVSQSVRHPSGVAGSLATPDPRVVGATPLDPGLKIGHLCRGASFTTLHNEWSGSCNAQMRHPWTIPRDRTCEEDCKYTTSSHPPCLLSALIAHYTQLLYKVHPRATGSLKHCLHDPDHKGDKNYDSKDSEDEHNDTATATLDDIACQDLLGATEET